MGDLNRNIANIPAARFAQLIDQKKVQFKVRTEKPPREYTPPQIDQQIQKIKQIICSNKQVQETVPKQSYTIQEDLTILSAVHDYRFASQTQVEEKTVQKLRLAPNFWQELQKTVGIKRSIESMRDRYKRFLKFLSNEDLTRIILFIQTYKVFRLKLKFNRKGIKGQLIFNKTNNSSKVLENIISGIEEFPEFSLNFDNYNKFSSQQTSVATTSITTYLNDQTNLHYGHNLSTIQANNQRVLIPPNLKRATNNYQEQLKILRKIIPENSQQIYKNQQIQRTKKEINYLQSKVDEYFQNQQQQTNQVIKLNDVISQLARYLHKKENVIIEEIEKFNGSIENLILYNQDPEKHKSLCWNQKEDKILLSAGNQSNIEFQQLVEAKGIKQIFDRIAFKKITLQFEFK